jgi:nucleotidyltransferase/DNA polymerase involved in DNA repair
MTKKIPFVLHVDGDGFFAYCELTRFPHLRGTPVVVGEERGIACAMTYEAKALGIPRGYPIFKIRKEFPQVTILPCHFELYEGYAEKLARLLGDHVSVLERYSIDECFALVYLPETWNKQQIEEWLQTIKTSIQNKLGLTYSFGIARTKVLAKIASKYQKPNGLTIIMEQDEKRILQQTDITSIWGIGRRLSFRFERLRISKAIEFAQWPAQKVVDHFNQPVYDLWQELNGKSVMNIGNTHDLAQSLQSTRSFTPFSIDPHYLVAEMLQNVDVVCARMRHYNLTTMNVSFYLKTTERKYHSSSITLPVFTNSPIAMQQRISEEVRNIIEPGTRYKATGVTAWGLRHSDDIPQDLFSHQKSHTDTHNVMNTVDDIRKKFGKGSISFAATLPSLHDRAQKAQKRALTDHFVYGLPLPYLGEVS